MANNLVDWARREAEIALSPLGRRWRHVQRVALLAERVGEAFRYDGSVLTAAAFLHDIGYAPKVVSTGFHPLDGGRYVRAAGQERLARLVAHHSGARYEAQLRGFADYENEFPFSDSPLDQALTYCDLTTSPDGDRVTLADRVAEIASRYGPDHTVARAINHCVPEFERAQADTERRMAKAGVVVTGSLALPG